MDQLTDKEIFRIQEAEENIKTGNYISQDIDYFIESI